MAASLAGLSSGTDLAAPSIPSASTGLLSRKSKGNEISSKAVEFEAILLGQWLQSSETAFGSVPGGEEDQDAGADQLKSFAFQHLAAGLAEKGGVGIAKMVESALAIDHSGAPSAQSREALQRSGDMQGTPGRTAILGHTLAPITRSDPREGR